jgi:7,8-dihydropterin-6-yl-methyl-4-(beta-D-ribofuranosyl)aminobenzene 5'-phosphate synthase
MRKFLISVGGLLAIFLFLPTMAAQGNGEIQVTLLYDNTVATEGVQSDWGFSCLIEGTEKTILFDAGTKLDVFLHNTKTLNVDTKGVESVVISHEHGDHTGALEYIMSINRNVSVYHPISFSKAFVNSVEQAKGESIPVTEPVEIAKNVFLTGELGDEIKETSLILKTGEGLVVITGCAHPGIVEILEKTKEIFDEDIYMIFGGFHLMNHSDEAVQDIISRLRALGVRKCGATHCTGDRQIELFRKAYGEDFVSIGVGKVVKFKSRS